MEEAIRSFEEGMANVTTESNAFSNNATYQESYALLLEDMVGYSEIINETKTLLENGASFRAKTTLLERQAIS